MKVLDSSCWIEFFAEGPRYSKLVDFFNSQNEIAIPSIVVFEVYRQLLKKLTPELAIQYTAQMKNIVPLDERIALYASELSFKFKLPTVDSLIYATARLMNAELITLDYDFHDLPGCRVISS